MQILIKLGYNTLNYDTKSVGQIECHLVSLSMSLSKLYNSIVMHRFKQSECGEILPEQCRNLRAHSFNLDWNSI